MAILVVAPLLVLIFLFMISSSSCSNFTYPITKPGCADQDSCGNVSIPYPFGTREGCYLDEGFYIQCLNISSNGVVLDPPQPVLNGTTFMVKDISLKGQLRIFFDVGHDCYKGNNFTRSDYRPTSMTLIETMAFNSTANKFTAIGCDTSAVITGITDETMDRTGCISTCGDRDDVNGTDVRPYHTGCMSTCGDKDDVKNGACSGIGCCQTSIPEGARKINVTLNSFNNYRDVPDFYPCSYGFLVEESEFKFLANDVHNFNNVSVPVVVDWVIENETCEVAKKNKTSFACKTNNSICYDLDGALGYRCKCQDGFQGNPYLSANGCQDIDECANSTLNKCASNSTCANTMGNYTCSCNSGYYGDGRKDGKGCIAIVPPPPPPHKKRNGPIIAAVGVSTGTAILVGFSFCLYSRLMRKKADRLREEYFHKNGGILLQQKLNGRGGGTYTTRIFTIDELQKATNDFDESQIIGQGGFGIVFKGELSDKTNVAIKKSRGVDHRQVEQFINEVILLSQINSRNVVKLLGCCLETEAPLLVYEFINNGTLFEHLHNKTKASKLSWDIRLRIASEVAGVLSYLHSVALPPIIHRDIKSANILLDQNYTAKVSDFGTSRLGPIDDNQVSTVVQGTHGYLDPEYLLTGFLTEKSDVYSFGIVLVEILTGKKALASERSEAERFLSNYFLNSLKDDILLQVIDRNICYNEYIEQIKGVSMVAQKCIRVKGEDRPYMKDVARELEALMDIKAQQFQVQPFEISSTEGEALLGLQQKVYARNDDTVSSSDLYPVPSLSTIEQMSLATAGGR